MFKFYLVNFFIFFQFISCNISEKQNLKNIEGMWEIYSVSSNGEVFYPKGRPPLVDYYVFNADSTGIKKKLKPNFNNTYTSSLDELHFEIKKAKSGHIFLNYYSNSNSWREKIKKLTKKELIISNNKFEYHYKRFEIDK